MMSSLNIRSVCYCLSLMELEEDVCYEFNPLHIMIPKAIAYVNCYDSESKWMKLFDLI